jgi:hypothetical protein
MRMRTTLRFLAAVALMSFGLLATPAGLALAADNSTNPTGREQCESQGYLWIDGKCANKKCPRAGTPSNPGETWIQTVDGEMIFRYCDGTTGKWVTLIRPSTTGSTGSPAVSPPAGGSR